MHCAGHCCFAAAVTCGESCPPTRSGGKWRSNRRTWSGFGCFRGRSGARWPMEAFCCKDIVRRIKNTPFRGRTRDFIAKVQALSYRLRTIDRRQRGAADRRRRRAAGHGAGRQSPPDRGPAGVAGSLADSASACSAGCRRACRSRAGIRRMSRICGVTAATACAICSTTATPMSSA